MHEIYSYGGFKGKDNVFFYEYPLFRRPTIFLYNYENISNTVDVSFHITNISALG